jgi:hypothetical protein
MAEILPFPPLPVDDPIEFSQLHTRDLLRALLRAHLRTASVPVPDQGFVAVQAGGVWYYATLDLDLAQLRTLVEAVIEDMTRLTGGN